MEFIAHDWCGAFESLGRFTHLPSGKTLVCQPYMRQYEWNKAQLNYFKQFALNIPVHDCSGSYTTKDTICLGTVGEIINRLEKKL